MITTRRGGYISSWGPLADGRGRRSSAIDTMANLPLLYWAAARADDGSFRAAGELHARMTQGAFVRPDLSTYHAVEYDPASGERARGYTFQGYADGSCWSRGQGWAIYGFAATARATASTPSGVLPVSRAKPLILSTSSARGLAAVVLPLMISPALGS